MKKDVKIIFIISALIVLVIVAILFIFFGGKHELPFNNKTTTTTKTDNPQTEERTTRTLVSTDKPYGDYADEEDILKILSRSFSLYGECQTGKEFTKNESTVADLSESEIYHIAFAFIDAYETYEKTKISGTETSYQITKDEMLYAIDSLFGRDYYNSFKIKDTFTIYGATFVESNGIYKGVAKVNACLTGRNPRYHLIKGYLDGNHYYLEFALYYNEYAINGNNIQAKAFASKDSAQMICEEKDIANNLDSFTKYRFSLVREGEKFILEKITKI